jgi:hypothetical protein
MLRDPLKLACFVVAVLVSWYVLLTILWGLYQIFTHVRIVLV